MVHDQIRARSARVTRRTDPDQAALDLIQGAFQQVALVIVRMALVIVRTGLAAHALRKAISHRMVLVIVRTGLAVRDLHKPVSDRAGLVTSRTDLERAARGPSKVGLLLNTIGVRRGPTAVLLGPASFGPAMKDRRSTPAVNGALRPPCLLARFPLPRQDPDHRLAPRKDLPARRRQLARSSA